VSELCGLGLKNVSLGDGTLKVMGKGNKERVVPIGRHLQRVLWRYINTHRPEPAMPNIALLFLSADGRPLTKDRVEKIIARLGKKAGLGNVRCPLLGPLQNNGGATETRALLCTSPAIDAIIDCGCSGRWLRFSGHTHFTRLQSGGGHLRAHHRQRVDGKHNRRRP